MGSAPQAARIVLHYRLLEKLGEGGMGVVWLADDTRLGRKVAVKFLPSEGVTDPGRHQRFEREARAAAALTHPGIATVYALETNEDEVFIVFEFVPGQSLRRAVRANGVPPAELLPMAFEIAEALAAAHAIGVVHRDLKPENVMRTDTGACKVLDFGLARVQSLAQGAATQSLLTAPGMVMGTVAYMSPEQLEGRDTDFRSDIFAFGILLYELATGVHPFQHDSTAATIAAIMTADPLPIGERNPLQPLELETIVQKCLRKRREQRYPSTHELAVDLRTLLSEFPKMSAETARPLPPTQPAQRPRGWFFAHYVLTLFVTIPVFVALSWHARADLSPTVRLPLFLLTCLALGLHWSARFAVLSAAYADPAALPLQLRRTRPWIRWSCRAIIVSLASIAVGIAKRNDGLAAVLVALAMGSLVWDVLIDPAVERASLRAGR